MVDQLIPKHDELPTLLTERRLLFLHRGIGGAPEAGCWPKYPRIRNCFPRGQASPIVYDGGCRDVA